jgi:hypothetical protein
VVDGSSDLNSRGYIYILVFLIFGFGILNYFNPYNFIKYN